MSDKNGATLNVERVKLDTLTEDPANVRTHDEANIEAIKGSLKRFGQQHPIIVDSDGVVRAGNGRLRAMRELGWTECSVVRTDLAGSELTAFAIADNRTGELADWDRDGLAKVLDALADEDAELREAAGFSAREVTSMVSASFGEVVDPGTLEPEPEPDPSEPEPEPDEHPVAQAGDVWLLGDHRIYCGDSLSHEAREALLPGGAKASMVFTDPPYNMGYAGGMKKRDTIANDAMSAEEWLAFSSRIASRVNERTCGCVYVCHSPSPDGRVIAGALDATMHYSASIVWAKHHISFGYSNYRHRHELIWFGWPEDHKRFFVSDRTLTDVWEFPKPSRSDAHPTMKPVALVAYAISHASRRGDTVYDPFLGSGTTLIAAEQLGRACLGSELEPRYVDSAIRRWQKMTGKEATHEASGDKFSERSPMPSEVP